MRNSDSSVDLNSSDSLKLCLPLTSEEAIRNLLSLDSVLSSAFDMRDCGDLNIWCIHRVLSSNLAFLRGSHCLD